MERPDYANLHAPPPDLKKTPKNCKLRTNYEHPNLNSKEYRKKPVNRTPKILSYFERISMNSDGVLILGCNNLRGRIWDGYVWGFLNIDDVGNEQSSCFKINVTASVTNLKFMKHNVFIVTLADGSLQIWSTKPDLPDIETFCLFKLHDVNKHITSITALDVSKVETNKIITGCNEGDLRVWTTSNMELELLNFMQSAHADEITSISCSPSNASIFSTCSRDRTALTWDHRLPRPACNLYNEHKVDFMTINWHTDELIFLGDESGKIYSIDPRTPNKFLHNLQVFNRPIRKIEISGKHLAVIGNTNTVKVFQLTDSNYNCVYEDSTSKDILRDVIWTSDNKENQIFTVGWGSSKLKHDIY